METFPQWIIILVVILVLARVSSFLSKRSDLPSAVIQLIIGILLGPSLFNILGFPIILGSWGSPAPSTSHAILKILAEVGLIQLMFLAGFKVDWSDLKKSFRLSFSISGLGFLLTAVSVTIFTFLFLDRWPEAIAMSAIMVASGLGISFYNLNEMNFLRSPAANVILGSAGVSGVFAVFLMILSQATHYVMAYGLFKMVIAVSWFLATLIMFLAITYFLLSRYLKLSSKSGFNKRPIQVLIGYLLLVAALYAWASMHFGSFAAVGVACLGGALLGYSELKSKSKIAEGFGSVLTSIPGGILFIIMGMEVNLRAAERSPIFLAILLLAVLGSKVFGFRIATRKEHLPPLEQDLVMFGNLHQGEMGILIAGYLLSRGPIDPSQFNTAIIVTVTLTTITTIMIKLAQSKLDLQPKRSTPFKGGGGKHYFFQRD